MFTFTVSAVLAVLITFASGVITALLYRLCVANDVPPPPEMKRYGHYIPSCDDEEPNDVHTFSTADDISKFFLPLNHESIPVFQKYKSTLPSLRVRYINKSKPSVIKPMPLLRFSRTEEPVKVMKSNQNDGF